MKTFKYILASIIIYICTVVLFGITAANIDSRKIIILYLVTILFLGIIGLASIIIKHFGKKKRILFYRGTGGINIFITVIILITISISSISKIYFKILADTGNKMTVSSCFKDFKEFFNYNRGFEKEEYNHIKFMYRKNSEIGMELVKTYIKDANDDCETVLGKANLKPLEIMFDYDEKMFKANSHLFENFGGIYVHNHKTDQRHINVLVKDAFKDILISSDMIHTLRHEYVHYSFDMFITENNMNIESIPIWFEEGTAEYVAYSPEFIYDRYPNKIIPFREIKNRNGWADYVNKEIDVYGQSFYFIHLLASEKGEGAIKEIMIKTKELGFEEAFKSFSGSSVEDYEKRLNNYAKNHWKNYKLNIKRSIVKRNYRDMQKNSMAKYIEQNSKDAEAILEMARVYDIDKNYAKAMELCEASVKADPSFAFGWYTLGRYSERGMDYKKAEEAYRKSIELDPQNASGYHVLAQVYLLSDVDKSIKTLEDGVNNCKDGKKFLTGVLNRYKIFNNDLSGLSPLMAYLSLVKSDEVFSTTIKISLIDKALKENPNAPSKARSELIKLKKKFEAERD